MAWRCVFKVRADSFVEASRVWNRVMNVTHTPDGYLWGNNPLLMPRKYLSHVRL